MLPEFAGIRPEWPRPGAPAYRKNTRRLFAGSRRITSSETAETHPRPSALPGEGIPKTNRCAQKRCHRFYYDQLKMKIESIVNHVQKEDPTFTTTGLAICAHKQCHEVFYMRAGDLVYYSDEQVGAQE